MNPFDRGLLVVFALAGVLAAAMAGAGLAGWAWPQTMYRAAAGMPGFYETFYALLAVFALAGLRLAWYGLHPGKKHAVVQEGALGKVRIALAAIESLVEKVAMDQKGIKEARAEVNGTAQGIAIRIKVAVAPDINVPRVSEILQSGVRDKVLEVTGIETHNIRISVDRIAAQKLRVE